MCVCKKGVGGGGGVVLWRPLQAGSLKRWNLSVSLQSGRLGGEWGRGEFEEAVTDG